MNEKLKMESIEVEFLLICFEILNNVNFLLPNSNNSSIRITFGLRKAGRY